VLGAGDEALPPIDRPATGRAAVPDLPDADPARLRTWSRAEDLVGMGLVGRAVDELERLGEAWGDPGAAALVRRRAAGLSETLGDDERAARLWAAAGDPEARAAAARADVRGHRYEEALASLRTLGTEDAAAEIAKLAPIVERTRTERMSFARGPGGAPSLAPFEVRDPMAVKADAADGGLRVVALAEDGEVLRLPFRWAGERLGLRVELELKRLEWGAGLRFVLRGPSDEIGVAVRGWGGGNVLEREVVCLLPEQTGHRTPLAGPAMSERIVLEVDVSAVTRDARCTLTEGDAAPFVATVPLERMPTAGEWELVVDPSPHGGVGGPAAAIAVVRGIDLTATRLELGGAPGPHPDATSAAVWDAVALADAGRFEEAVAAVRALPPEHDEIAHALRTRLPTFGPVVREAYGDRYWPAFQRGWDIAINAHPDDDEVRRALTTGLAGLKQVRPDAGDVATRQRVALLLVARARAWAGLGEPAAARRDMVDAAERMRAILPALGVDEARAARQRVATGWIDLAEVLAAEGDSTGAADAVSRAVATAAAPEIVLDQVRARPALAGVADRATP
jgi:hypothetical protein